MAHDPTRCTRGEKCEQCIGLRMYPEVTLCEFCNTMHAGNSNNCPQVEAEDYYPFPDDPPGTEQLCWSVFNAVRDMTALVKEAIEMIPQSTNRSAGGTQAGNGGGGGGFRGRGNQGGGQGRQQRSGLPYLNVNNQDQYLSLDDKVTAKIVDCRVGDGSGSSAVTLRLAIKGKSILWGLSLNNPSLDILTDAFGRSENDWVGQSIQMWLEEDSFTEKVWIHCSADNVKEAEPDKETAPTRSRKRG